MSREYAGCCANAGAANAGVEAFDLTYLFITHDLWVSDFLCDRIAVNAGRIVELGPPKKFFTNPSTHIPKLCSKLLLTTRT